MKPDGRHNSYPVADHEAVSSVSMFCMGDEFYGLMLKDQDGNTIFE